MMKKIKKMLVWLCVAAVVVAVCVVGVKKNSMRYVLHQAGMEPFGYEVCMRDANRLPTTDVDFYNGIGDVMYETAVVRGVQRGTGKLMLVCLMKTHRSWDNWNVMATACAEEESFVELRWEEPNPARTVEEYTAVSADNGGGTGAKNGIMAAPPTLESDWKVKRHYVCYGENAATGVYFKHKALDEDIAVRISQSGERYWIHLMSYEDSEKNAWPKVHDMLVESGCIVPNI